jgi:hypothetical protein
MAESVQKVTESRALTERLTRRAGRYQSPQAL